MQKALSSDLKTAAAPAPKKYPPPHVRFSQKISTLPAVTETFGKYPLNRFYRNSQKISVSPAVTETFGKYLLKRLSRNSQKIFVSPVMIQPSKNIPSTAVSESGKFFTLFYML